MKSHSRYSLLDGIRGFAALLVLTRHTQDFWNIYFFRSYLAVDLFFILSGFVIAFAYDEKIKNGLISLKKFALIRIVRLYPVFLLSLELSIIYSLSKLFFNHDVNQTTLLNLLQMALLTTLFLPSQQVGVDLLFPLNGPFWSLAFELLANFLYAAFQKFLNDKTIVMVVITLGLVIGYISHDHRSLDIGFTWGVLSILAGFARSLFGIFVGLYLYKNRIAIEKQISPISNIEWIALLGIIVILMSPSIGRFDWVIDFLTVTLFFPFFVICASFGKSTKFNKVFLILGSASYPIYLLHVPISGLINLYFNSYIKYSAPFSGIIFTFFLIFLSLMIEKYYDIPFRKWLSIKLKIKL